MRTGWDRDSAHGATGDDLLLLNDVVLIKCYDLMKDRLFIEIRCKLSPEAQPDLLSSIMTNECHNVIGSLSLQGSLSIFCVFTCKLYSHGQIL